MLSNIQFALCVLYVYIFDVCEVNESTKNNRNPQ